MSKLGVGVIGTGGRGGFFCQHIIESTDENVTLVAMADICTDSCQLIADHYGLTGVQITDDYRQILSRDDIDVVMIATGDGQHCEPTIAALNAGKHVFIEKPLAINLEDCDAMIAAANKADVLCCMGFNMRCGPVHRKVYDLIQDGAIGKVTSIEANEWYFGGRTYFRRWNRLRKYGGGLWITKATHDFDLITWLAGGQPTRIAAMSSLSHYKPIEGAGPRCRDCKIKETCPDYYDVTEPLENWFADGFLRIRLKLEEQGKDTAPDICLYNSDKDTFDNASTIIEYDNDIRATYTVNVIASKTTRQVRINGTKGLLEGDLKTSIITVTERYSENVTTYDLADKTKGGHGGADDKVLSGFFDTCHTGAEVHAGLKDGRLAVKLGLAARQSCDEGRMISLV